MRQESGSQFLETSVVHGLKLALEEASSKGECCVSIDTILQYAQEHMGQTYTRTEVEGVLERSEQLRLLCARCNCTRRGWVGLDSSGFPVVPQQPWWRRLIRSFFGPK